MTASKFYRTDQHDPCAPVVLDEYHGIRPGDRVTYTGAIPMPGDLTVTELVRFTHYVSAILNDGEWEVTADNLAVIEGAS